MSCVVLKVTGLSKPLKVGAVLSAQPMDVCADLATKHMFVSIGLVCSVGDTTVMLVSRDGYGLLSKDGYLLYGKRL